jgi:hypothetical protein
MLKQIIVTLDTSDPLQAQLLVEYLASNDRVRFGRCCMLLGYLAGTQQPSENDVDSIPEPSTVPPAPKVGLTLEDLKISQTQQALTVEEISIGITPSAQTPLSANPEAAPSASSQEVKKVAKPKLGKGLFGLD